MLLSPRVLFSLMLGFGATGLLLRNYLAGFPLAAVAVLCGWLFELWIVAPLWSFLLKFGSRPVRTLESLLLEPAKVVANFDARGEGLVAVELDGEVVQILGRLDASDRRQNIRMRAGDEVMVTAIDLDRRRCTVTSLGV